MYERSCVLRGCLTHEAPAQPAVQLLFGIETGAAVAQGRRLWYPRGRCRGPRATLGRGSSRSTCMEGMSTAGDRCDRKDGGGQWCSDWRLLGCSRLCFGAAEFHARRNALVSICGVHMEGSEFPPCAAPPVRGATGSARPPCSPAQGHLSCVAFEQCSSIEFRVFEQCMCSHAMEPTDGTGPDRQLHSGQRKESVGRRQRDLD